jgi:serine/threonine protein kinase/tetratricopeptide (TPR) repeat protein
VEDRTVADQDSSHDYDLLDHLVEEFNERFRRGERPSIREYCERYPRLAEELRELLPAMAQVEQAKEEFGETTAVAPPPPVRSLGDFHILREVGHGGMGVVYEAEQVSLGRRVALKVLTDRLMRDERQKRRFEREAKAAAKLHHTNIVPVFGTGEAGGVPYYVMQFIQGMGLDLVIEELAGMSPEAGGPTAAASPANGPAAVGREASLIARSLMTGEFRAGSAVDGPANEAEATLTHADAAQPAAPSALAVLSHSEGSLRTTDTSGVASSVTLPGQSQSGGKSRKLTYWQSIAKVGAQVADALAYAHAQGVIHRDIKPSNLLLDLAGTVWVTDFGLAKAEGTDNLTHTGDIVGTLRYLPPEAFDGRADARGDIYALGLTLYELAALRPAFDERERNRLIKQVTTTDPTPVSRVRKGVPRDLETIIHKAIDRDPARRYPTAAALREDLQRFVEDEPIQARRQSSWERARRWCRHNPAVAALVAFIALLMVGVTVASVVAAAHFDQLAREAAQTAENQREARKLAEDAKQAALNAKQQAETSYARARRAVDDSFRKVSESQLLKVPGLQPLRAELLQSALGFYNEFLKERTDDPALRADAAVIHVRIGRVLTDLGQEKDARAAIDAGLRAFEAAVAAEPANLDLKAGLADAWMAYGELYYWTKNTPETLKGYRKAAELGEILVKARPENRADKMALARVLNGFAIAAPALERVAAHRRCLELREDLLRTGPDDPALLHAVGESLSNIAILMNGADREQLREKLQTQLLATNYTERAVRLFPSSIEYGTDLAMGYWNTANTYWSLREGPAAVAAHRKAVTHLDGMARANPSSEEVRLRQYEGRFRLIQFLYLVKQPEEAASIFQETADLLAHLPADTLEERFEAARICTHALDYSSWVSGEEAARLKSLALNALRVYVMSESADLARLEADPYLHRLIQLPAPKEVLKASPLAHAGKAAPPPKPVVPEHRPAMVAGYLALAHIQADLNQFADARQSLERTLKLRQALAAERPHDATAAADLANVWYAFGDLQWKAGHAATGVKAWETGLGMVAAVCGATPQKAPERDQLAGTARSLAERYAVRALWAEAAAYYNRAVTAGSTDPWDWSRAGQCYFAAGDTDNYQRLCRLTRQRFGGIGSPSGWPAVVLLHAMDPDAAQDPAALALLAEAAQFGRHPLWHIQPSLWHILPSVWQVAAGQYDAAIGRLAAKEYTDASLASVWRAATLAVAHHRLGHADEAHRWLTATEDRYASRMHQFTSHNSLSAWYTPIEYAAAYRWAASVVTGKRPPPDPLERLYRSRMYAQLGTKAKAEAEFTAAKQARPDDPIAWIACGRHLRESGDTAGAEQAFTRAATIARNQLDRFLDAGWWTVGPYYGPFTVPAAPELDPDPDPAKPIARDSGPGVYRWLVVSSRGPDGTVELTPASMPALNVVFSYYAMTDVYAPDQRTTALAIASSGPLRVWLNGHLVYEADKPPESSWDHVAPLTPIVLNAGRNRFLVRVNGSAGNICKFTLRLADHPFDRMRLFGAAGLWPEAVTASEELLRRLPDHNFIGSFHVRFLVGAGKPAQARTALDRLCAVHAATTVPYVANDLLRAAAVVPGFRREYLRLAELTEKGWLDKSSRPAWLLCDVGLGYLRAQRWDDAARLLEECSKKHDYPPCWPGLALVYQHRGQREQAVALVRKAETLWASAVAARLKQPDLRLAMEGVYLPGCLVMLDEARTALKIQPGPTAEFASLQDRYRKLLAGLDPNTAWFDRLLLHWPLEPRLYLARAVHRAQLKRDKEAEVDFARAVALGAKIPDVWLGRGRAYAEAGRIDKAAADLGRYLDLLPRDESSFGVRTLKIYELLRFPEVFAKLIVRQPRDTHLVVCRCRAWLTTGRWAEAAADYRRVIRQRPVSDETFEAAASYLLAGDRVAYDELCQWLSAKTKQQPTVAGAYVLARTAAVVDPPGVPVEELRRWAEQANQAQVHGWHVHVLGLAALRAGDWESALRHFAESERMGWSGPGRGLNRFGMAIAQARLHRFEDAHKSLAEGLRLVLGDRPTGEAAPHELAVHGADWVEFVLLRREAERLLNEKETALATE